LHGNWRGIDSRGRVLLARALHAGFGGTDAEFPSMGDLVNPAEIEQARRWGLAIRLGQRLSGGLEAPLQGSSVELRSHHLELRLEEGWHAMRGEAVERRLKSLAHAFDLKPKITMAE
jgi:exopolyphosphatase/guanosine-5'-triphosphate,3'-diphosphate pyrophosphatase